MAGLAAPWWLAGGWALDAFIGTRTREHADLEMSVLHCDTPLLFEHLSGWDMHLVRDGTLEAWRGEAVPAEIHQAWARPQPEGEFLEFMFESATESDWIFRRDARIRRPLAEIGADNVLAPEIVLLFKAKEGRPKDSDDFARAVPLLSADQRDWLRNALTTAHPDHPWVDRLCT